MIKNFCVRVRARGSLNAVFGFFVADNTFNNVIIGNSQKGAYKMTTRLTRKQFWPISNAPRAKPRQQIESGIQMALMRWADEHPFIGNRVHGNLFVRLANGGKRSKWAGHKSVLEGEKRGIPDLLLPIMRGGYGGLWIELKSPTGVVSLHQKEWIATLRALGYACCVCYSLDEAIKQTERYLALKDKEPVV